jgi:hypothetical protein
MKSLALCGLRMPSGEPPPPIFPPALMEAPPCPPNPRPRWPGLLTLCPFGNAMKKTFARKRMVRLSAESRLMCGNWKDRRPQFEA